MTGVRRPRALDLFCGAGGVSEGLRRAGFKVVGVDINPQPHHRGGTFVQADALTFPLEGFDFIWASPPCQRFSVMSACRDPSAHPDLIAPIRARLESSESLWVIENVPGAPLRGPIVLCGTMFPPLRVYRHRLFEANFRLAAPEHPPHKERFPRAGYGASGSGWMSVSGHIRDTAAARTAMGIDWMPRDALTQAIPPAYAEWIGRQALEYLEEKT